MKSIRHVGLDVHRDSIVMAVADEGQEPETLGTIPNSTTTLIKHLKKLGDKDQIRCCYEAGPTGFTLYRALLAAGYHCVVIAPSLIPKTAGDRVKTDRRDAKKLARYLRSGDLTVVTVPDEATEAMRDLERAREAAKESQRRVQQQLSKFLLRHGKIYREKASTWTKAHQEWIQKQEFGHPAQVYVRDAYLRAVEDAERRVEDLTQEIGRLVDGWSHAALVTAFQALRGFKLVSAVTVAAEVGDFRRFESADQFMAFVGLVPSEASTGGKRRQGSITKTGNTHVRRILVEAAWNYQYKPNLAGDIRKRNERVSPEVKAIAWKAQKRLHDRFIKLVLKGKSKKTAVIAVARELAGFVWAIGREEKLLRP